LRGNSSGILAIIRRDPAGLGFGEQLGSRSAPQRCPDDVRQIGDNLAPELKPFLLANIALI
jgi:hypothetical protein